MMNRVRDPPAGGFFTDMGMEGENGFHGFEHSRRADNMFFGGKYKMAMDEYTSAADYFAKAKGNTSNSQALEVLEFFEDYHSARAEEVSRLSSALVKPLQRRTATPTSEKTSPNLETSVYGQWYHGQPPTLTEQRFYSNTSPTVSSPEALGSNQQPSGDQPPLRVDLKNASNTREGAVRIDGANGNSISSFKETLYEYLVHPWQRDFYPQLAELINESDEEKKEQISILFSEALYRTQRNVDSLLDLTNRVDAPSTEVSDHLSKYVTRMEQSINLLEKSKLKDRIMKLEKELEIEKKKKNKYKKMAHSRSRSSRSSSGNHSRQK